MWPRRTEMARQFRTFYSPGAEVIGEETPVPGAVADLPRRTQCLSCRRWTSATWRSAVSTDRVVGSRLPLHSGLDQDDLLRRHLPAAVVGLRDAYDRFRDSGRSAREASLTAHAARQQRARSWRTKSTPSDCAYFPTASVLLGKFRSWPIVDPVRVGALAPSSGQNLSIMASS